MISSSNGRPVQVKYPFGQEQSGKDSIDSDLRTLSRCKTLDEIYQTFKVSPALLSLIIGVANISYPRRIGSSLGGLPAPASKPLERGQHRDLGCGRPMFPGHFLNMANF